MKNIYLTTILVVYAFLSKASNFDSYTQHTAKDRFLVVFDQSVSSSQADEIVNATGLVSHHTNIPSPRVTICFSEKTDEAIDYFKRQPNVLFVSFFITDGKYFAGVLNRLFVKLKNPSDIALLNEVLSRMGLEEPSADKYINNLYKVKISNPNTLNTIEICKQLSEFNWVEYASPDYLLNPLVCSNDPLYNRQWAINNTGSVIQGNGTPDADMDVDSAWLTTTGNPNIKIGIIDSGVDTLQEDLLDNMLPGHDALGDTTDGYPTPNYPSDGHGTCCAGIAAAVQNNGLGISGIAPTCKIVPVRAFYYVVISPGADPIPVSSADAFSDAIGWAWSDGQADILSNSWGLPPSLISLLPGGTQPVNDAIVTAHTQGRGGKGIAMFFSSGNEGDSIGPIWPASLPQTIAVNATSMCDERKNVNDCSPENWGGDFGPGLDFGAPGVKIVSTDMLGSNGFVATDYYYLFNGTSAACPNAAAVGALVLSIRNDFTAEDVRNVIAQTCDKVGGYGYDSLYLNGTWSKELGYGRVNANRAIDYSWYYTSMPDGVINDQIMKVYPNPARDVLFINGIYQRGVFQCYDLSGRLVFQTQLNNGSNRLQIDHLQTGVYLMKIFSGERTLNQKLIIAR